MIAGILRFLNYGGGGGGGGKLIGWKEYNMRSQSPAPIGVSALSLNNQYYGDRDVYYM